MLIPAQPCLNCQRLKMRRAKPFDQIRLPKQGNGWRKISISTTITKKTIRTISQKYKVLKSREIPHKYCIEGIKIVFVATI